MRDQAKERENAAREEEGQSKGEDSGCTWMVMVNSAKVRRVHRGYSGGVIKTDEGSHDGERVLKSGKGRRRG